jgi:hypothetical protein
MCDTQPNESKRPIIRVRKDQILRRPKSARGKIWLDPNAPGYDELVDAIVACNRSGGAHVR